MNQSSPGAERRGGVKSPPFPEIRTNQPIRINTNSVHTGGASFSWKFVSPW